MHDLLRPYEVPDKHTQRQKAPNCMEKP